MYTCSYPPLSSSSSAFCASFSSHCSRTVHFSTFMFCIFRFYTWALVFESLMWSTFYDDRRWHPAIARFTLHYRAPSWTLPSSLLIHQFSGTWAGFTAWRLPIALQWIQSAGVCTARQLGSLLVNIARNGIAEPCDIFISSFGAISILISTVDEHKLHPHQQD